MRMSLLHVLLMMTTVIARLFMCLWILPSDLVPVFVKTFEAFCELIHLACLAIMGKANVVFRLALYRLKDITERYSAVAGDAGAVKGEFVVDRTVAASLGGLILENIDMVCKGEEWGAVVGHLNIILALFVSQVYAQAALYYEFRDAQHECSLLEAVVRSDFSKSRPLSVNLDRLLRIVPSSKPSSCTKRFVQGSVRRRCLEVETRSRIKSHLLLVGVDFLTLRC